MIPPPTLSAAGRQAVCAGLFAACLLGAPPADAQTYVRGDCRPLVSGGAADQTPLTARWYRRFWTGECAGLHGCIRGSPNWNEIVGQLVARSPAPQRRLVLTRACRLGVLIGAEWTRPRDVRRIDSGDLRHFGATLTSGGDVLAGIERVEGEARAKIGRRPG